MFLHAKEAYKILDKDFQNKNVTCAWLNRIRGILNDCGMSYIWNRQTCISDKWLKLVVHHLSFFRCIGYKSDFPFLYYANAQLLSVAYGLKLIVVCHIFGTGRLVFLING
jgi:hypothetical protein